MNKSFFGLLIAVCALLTACETQMKVQSERLAPEQTGLANRRVVIVSYEDALTHDLVVYTKNYLQRGLKEARVNVVGATNVRFDEAKDSAATVDSLRLWQPDVVLQVRAVNSDYLKLKVLRDSKNEKTVFQSRKKLWSAGLAFELLTAPRGDSLWKSAVQIRKIPDTEVIDIARKTAKLTIQNLKKDVGF